MTAGTILLIVAMVFFIVLLLGHPLSFTLGGLGIIFGVCFWDNPNVLNLFIRSVNQITTNSTYVCGPLFIFMGAVLERSGAANELFDSMYIVLGRLKGGLAITTIVICTLLAAATGIIGASISLMTMLALPTMMKHNYNLELATGTIMGAGCLGTLIPPSIIMVIYGAQAQLSIGKLFAGGIGAGLLLSSLYLAYVIVMTNVVKKDWAPAIPKEESDRYSKNQKIKMTIKSVCPTLGLIIVVLGSIMFGIATPTEASALGCVGAIILSAANRKLNWELLKKSCYDTIVTNAMIMWIILGASMFTSVFLGLGGAEAITGLVAGLAVNRWIIFSIIILIIVIMGMFIDSYGVLLIGIPLFTPIVYSLGYDPIWFAIIFVVMIQVSYLSPPFAYACFYVKGVSKTPIPIGRLYKAVLPFLVLQIICVVLLCLFPGIITWLPGKLM
ncbi:MAG: TRAP transporter large permease subunit [Dehalobacterium sp.]